MSRHWADAYIGKPHAPDGEGPEAFSCWGLVRHAMLAQKGIALPFVAVADADANNVAAIKESASVSGLRRVDRVLPRDMEIIVFRSVVELHVALAVVANGRLGLLDSTSERGVQWNPWKRAEAGSCPEIWGWSK